MTAGLVRGLASLLGTGYLAALGAVGGEGLVVLPRERWTVLLLRGIGFRVAGLGQLMIVR